MLTRSYMKRAGKRVKAWNAVRASLKREFAAAGITRCELRYENCTDDNYLSFAHSRKRRLMGDRIREVALCCFNCHHTLDVVMSHEDMEREVLRVIAAREIA